MRNNPFSPYLAIYRMTSGPKFKRDLHQNMVESFCESIEKIGLHSSIALFRKSNPNFSRDILDRVISLREKAPELDALFRSEMRGFFTAEPSALELYLTSADEYDWRAFGSLPPKKPFKEPALKDLLRVQEKRYSGNISLLITAFGEVVGAAYSIIEIAPKVIPPLRNNAIQIHDTSKVWEIFLKLANLIIEHSQTVTGIPPSDIELLKKLKRKMSEDLSQLLAVQGEASWISEINNPNKKGESNGLRSTDN